MSWDTLSEHKLACSVANFYSGVEVWMKRPNVVNKRLLGAVTVVEDTVSTDVNLQEVGDAHDEERGRQVLRALAQVYSEEMRRGVDNSMTTELVGEAVLKCILRQLLPKMRSIPRGLEAVLVDETHHSVAFCPLSSFELPSSIPLCSYKLQFSPTAGQEQTSARYVLMLVQMRYLYPMIRIMS